MPVVKIEDIAHVRFLAPDLAAMRAFLTDFGLIPFEANGRLYGKGHDGRPFLHVTEPGEAEFRAVGFRAASVDDLAALAPFAAPLTAWLDAHATEAVLVRPDRYVFGTSNPATLATDWKAHTSLEPGTDLA